MHDHSNNHASSNIGIAFLLNLVFVVIEIIGGLLTNSVAILADALHDLGDSVSLGLGWYMEKASKKKRSKNFSYGYRRFSLLAALINSVILILGSVFILYFAIPRLLNPETTNAKGMLGLAILGIIVNGAAVIKLKNGKTMNERVVSWHLLEDVFGWVAVLIVSIVMLFGDFEILDPILSIVFAFYILWNTAKYLKQTLMIFLQGVPSGLDILNLEKEMLNISKVTSVHDTHIWSLDGEHNILTTHVVIDKASTPEEAINIKCKTRTTLANLGIDHTTIEVEFENEECDLKEC